MVLQTLESNNVFDWMKDPFFRDPRCCDPLKYSLKWILVLLFFPKRENAASTLTDCHEQEIGEGTSTQRLQVRCLQVRALRAAEKSAPQNQNQNQDQAEAPLVPSQFGPKGTSSWIEDKFFISETFLFLKRSTFF